MDETALSGAGVSRKNKVWVETFPLGEQTTVFQAEIFSILYFATKEEVNASNRKTSSIEIAKQF